MEFLVPTDCRTEDDLDTQTFLKQQKTCQVDLWRIEDLCTGSLQGRWACKCQVAGTGFQNPKMINGNFIKFSEEIFGVIFLELHSLSLYKRVAETRLSP